MNQLALHIEKGILVSLMLLKENRKKMGMAQQGSKLTWVKRILCEIINWWIKSLVTLVWELLLSSVSSPWVSIPQCFHEYRIRLPSFLLYSSHFVLHLNWCLQHSIHVFCRIKSTALSFGTPGIVVFSVSCFSILHLLNVRFCL